MRHKEYKQSLGTRIDLNRRHLPHEAVQKAWADSGVADHYYDINEIAENKTEWRFFTLVNSCKPPSKIVHKITSIYRKRVGNKEYCFLHNQMNSKDYYGNAISNFRVLGKYSYPHIEVQRGVTGGYDPATHQVTNEVGAVSSSMEERYDWEFKDIVPQLKEWYSNQVITDETNLYVKVGSKKYTVETGFEHYIALSMDDLVLINQAGINAAVFTNTNQLLAMAKKVASDKVTELMQGTKQKNKIPKSLRI